MVVGIAVVGIAAVGIVGVGTEDVGTVAASHCARASQCVGGCLSSDPV